MDADDNQMARGLLPLWTLASSIGLGLGAATYWLFLRWFAPGLNTLAQDAISAIGGGLFGALVGTAQKFVLDRQERRIGHWIVASTAGGVVAGGSVLAVGEIAMEGTPGVFGAVVAIGGTIGASLGIAQWLVLRTRLRRAGWWVVASTSALAFGSASAVVFAIFLQTIPALDAMRSFLAIGFGLVLVFGGYAAITGGVLTWLLRKSID